MKRWLYWAGAVVSIACLAFFARALASQWASLSELDWGGLLGAALLPAVLLHLCTYALAAKAWQLGLRMFAQRVSQAESARILLLSQIGKYLPGNLGHHVGRVLLARRAGLGAEAVVASMLVDTLLVLAAGALCSLPAAGLLLATAADRSADLEPLLLWGLPAVVAGVLVVLASARVRHQLGRRWPVAFRPSPGALGGIFACHALSFAIGAAALYLLCEALAGAAGSAAPGKVLGAYAAAWVLGFLMPGSPAGLGVRELVLLVGLGPMYGPGIATAATALLRLVTTTADGLAFAIGAALSRRET